MKYLLVSLLIPFVGLGQKQSADFLINGNIKGLPDSTLVFLARPGSPTDMLSSAYSKGGKFVLFGKIADPDIYQVNYIGYSDQSDIFLSASRFTLSGDIKTLKKLTVTGSALHKEFESYNSLFDPFKVKLGDLVQKINQTAPGVQRDSLIGLFEQNRQKVIQHVEDIAKTKPASPVSAYIVFVTSGISQDMNSLEQRFNYLNKDAKETTYGKEIAKIIAASKIGNEGSKAADFTQNDTSNNPVSLSSFKGKYVLVDFWASWCGPCRLENPNVVAAYNAFKDKNFTVLGVSLDQNRDKWIAAIHADNLSWTQVSDLKYWSNAVAQLYKITSIPANFLIDPNGIIIGKNLRGEALIQTLQKYIQ